MAIFALHVVRLLYQAGPGKVVARWWRARQTVRPPTGRLTRAWGQMPRCIAARDKAAYL